MPLYQQSFVNFKIFYVEFDSFQKEKNAVLLALGAKMTKLANEIPLCRFTTQSYFPLL